MLLLFTDIRYRRYNGLRWIVYETSDGSHAVFQHEAIDFHPGRHAFAFERGLLVRFFVTVTGYFRNFLVFRKFDWKLWKNKNTLAVAQWCRRTLERRRWLINKIKCWSIWNIAYKLIVFRFTLWSNRSSSTWYGKCSSHSSRKNWKVVCSSTVPKWRLFINTFQRVICRKIMAVICRKWITPVRIGTLLCWSTKTNLRVRKMIRMALKYTLDSSIILLPIN